MIDPKETAFVTVVISIKYYNMFSSLSTASTMK